MYEAVAGHLRESIHARLKESLFAVPQSVKVSGKIGVSIGAGGRVDICPLSSSMFDWLITAGRYVTSSA